MRQSFQTSEQTPKEMKEATRPEQTAFRKRGGDAARRQTADTLGLEMFGTVQAKNTHSRKPVIPEHTTAAYTSNREGGTFVLRGLK